MTKDSLDKRLNGVKCYFMSYNLKKPEQTTNEELIDEVLSACAVKRVACSSKFDTEYFGEVRYTQLVMNERISLAEIRQQLQSQSKSQSVASYGVGSLPANLKQTLCALQRATKPFGV